MSLQVPVFISQFCVLSNQAHKFKKKKTWNRVNKMPVHFQPPIEWCIFRCIFIGIIGFKSSIAMIQLRSLIIILNDVQNNKASGNFSYCKKFSWRNTPILKAQTSISRRLPYLDWIFSSCLNWSYSTRKVGWFSFTSVRASRQ